MLKLIPPATVEHVLPPNLDYEYFEDGSQHPFRHTARTFELVNAWWLADASLLAYAPKDFAIGQLRDAGWTVDADQPFTGSSTVCYVAYSPHAAIVAFRGTRAYKPGDTPPTLASVRDILADICTDGRFGLIESGRGAAVHEGFHTALNQVWEPMLLPCLTRLEAENPARTFWFTGHSLGAALATLAADRFRDVRGLYTFGSPLVGDRAFAEGFVVNAFRFVNNNDLVPQVPAFGPCGFPPHVRPYEHVGHLKYINCDGVLQDNPSRWERMTDAFRGRYGHLLALADQLRTGWIRELPEDGFNDHAPLYYALHVWNAYARQREAP